MGICSRKRVYVLFLTVTILQIVRKMHFYPIGNKLKFTKLRARLMLYSFTGINCSSSNIRFPRPTMVYDLHKFSQHSVLHLRFFRWIHEEKKLFTQRKYHKPTLTEDLLL